MSFSFTVRGATAALALAAVAATAGAYVGLLPEDADRDVIARE